MVSFKFVYVVTLTHGSLSAGATLHCGSLKRAITQFKIEIEDETGKVFEPSKSFNYMVKRGMSATAIDFIGDDWEKLSKKDRKAIEKLNLQVTKFCIH